MSLKFQAETKSTKGVVLIDCPGCDGKMPDNKYVCSRCLMEERAKSRTPPLMASEPEYHPKVGGRTGGCTSCSPERIADCHERVRSGWICACELPDKLDFLIIGKIDVSEIRELLSKKTTSRWNNKDGGIFDE